VWASDAAPDLNTNTFHFVLGIKQQWNCEPSDVKVNKEARFVLKTEQERHGVEKEQERPCSGFRMGKGSRSNLEASHGQIANFSAIPASGEEFPPNEGNNFRPSRKRTRCSSHLRGKQPPMCFSIFRTNSEPLIHSGTLGVMLPLAHPGSVVGA